MKLTNWMNSLSEAAIDRYIRLLGVVFVVGLVAFGAFYYLDQRTPGGPSLKERRIETAEKAVAKAPNSAGLRLQLAAAYEEAEQYDDALGQMREILKADPKYRGAVLGTAKIYIKKDESKQAEKYLRDFIAGASGKEFSHIDPQLGEAHYMLGNVLYERGETTGAVKEFRAAVAIDRTDADALYMLGRALTRDGKPIEAVIALRSALLFVPKGWDEPRIARGLAYMRIGAPVFAIAAGGSVDSEGKPVAPAKGKAKVKPEGAATHVLPGQEGPA